MFFRRPLTLIALFLVASLAARADFSFVQVTDSHVQGVPSAVASDQRVRDMFTQIAALSPRPDLVVHTGDITESGLPAEFSEFNKIQRETLGGIPLYATAGNHDIRWNPLGKAAFEHDSGQPAYRSFDHQNVHFILLDSTVALEHWGHFDQSELDWLKSDLEKTGARRPIIVGFHHWIGRAPMMVDNEDALLAMLRPYNIRLFLIGHGHSDILWNINGTPAIMAKGLYQGSYNIVRVTKERLQVIRRSDEDPTPTKLLVDVPLRRESLPAMEASVTAAAGTLVATFKSTEMPADSLVTGRVDDGSVTPQINLDGSADGWTGKFAIAGLSPGVHRVLITSTLPDGRAYLTPLLVTLSGDNQVKPQWQVNVGSAVQGTLTGDEKSVFVPTTGGELIALDKTDGKIRWRFATTGALYSPPAIAADMLIFGSADGSVYAIDRETGALRWKTDAGAPVFAGAVVAQEIAAIGTTDGRILGISTSTGKRVWTAMGSGMYQSRAATDNKHHFYVGGWDNYFRCLDITTGVEQWKQMMGESLHFSPAIGSPTLNDDGTVAFVSSDDGILHAVDSTTGAKVWEASNKLGYSSPLFTTDGVYSASLADDGSIFRFDAKTGATTWQKPTGSVIYDSSCVAAGKNILVGSVSGTLSALHADTGSVQWQYHLAPGHLFSTPWATSDHVFVATMSGEVVSIPLP